MRRRMGRVAGLVVVAVGCGGPQETRTATRTSPPPAGSEAYASPSAGMPGGAMSGEFAAEIVAADATGRTVTLRESAVGGRAVESPAMRTRTGTGTTGATAPSGTTTVSVEGMAGDSLRDLKTGDRVVVTCTMGAATGSAGGPSTAGSSTANTGSTSSAGTAGTTGAGGMGTTGGSASGTAATHGTSTGGYAGAGTPGMGSALSTTGGSVLSGCRTVTAIRKAG